MGKKKSQAETFGIAAADVVMKAAHMTFNAPRGRNMVRFCIKELKRRLSEIKPKKATPHYKAARYGKSARSPK